jgi:hypothetical protein
MVPAKTWPERLEIPELSRFDHVFVAKGYRNIIGRVELGGVSRSRRLGSRLRVGGERSAVLGFDGPEAALVIGARAREATHAPQDLCVAGDTGRSLRHGFEALRVCVCLCRGVLLRRNRGIA